MKVIFVFFLMAVSSVPILKSPIPVDPECLCARVWPDGGSFAATAEGLTHNLVVSGIVTPDSPDDGTNGVCADGECPGPTNCDFNYKIDITVAGVAIYGAAVGNPVPGPAILGTGNGPYSIAVPNQLNSDNACDQQNNKRKKIFILHGTNVFVNGVEELAWVKGGSIKFTFKCGVCAEATA